MHYDWGTSVAEGSLADAPIAEPPHLRLVRRRIRPTFSVVLATQRLRSDFAEALRELALACAHADAQLIIISSDPQVTTGRLASQHAEYICATADVPASTMRERAMRRCTGDIVVLLDDTLHARESWAERVRISVQRHGVSISGNGIEAPRAGEWGSYFATRPAADD